MKTRHTDGTPFDTEDLLNMLGGRLEAPQQLAQAVLGSIKTGDRERALAFAVDAFAEDFEEIREVIIELHYRDLKKKPATISPRGEISDPDNLPARVDSAPPSARQMEVAHGAWLRIMDAARRVRVLSDAVFETTVAKEGMGLPCSILADTALMSWRILNDFYDANIRGSKLGEVDHQLLLAMDALLSIRCLATEAARWPAGFESFPVTLRDLAAAIHSACSRLEEQVGGDWEEADPSIPARWLEKGARV